ncbi:MAG: hypothetical protein AAFX08_08000 [Pseudomonadota bacterium]
MILRRVIEHVRAQNWTAVALDFVIVVVGVFIGIQVANWNDARGDRLHERQLFADMLADLEIDRAQYANAMSVAARRVSAANASLVGAELPSIDFSYVIPGAYADDLIAAAKDVSPPPETLWTDVIIGYFPIPSTATFDALAGAGDTQIIRDRTLVKDIQIYRNSIDTVVRQNDKLSMFRRDTLNAGAKYGLAPYVQMAPSDYFELVKDQADLAAAIRISATFTIFHYGDIRDADDQAALLQKRLQSLLKDN